MFVYLLTQVALLDFGATRGFDQEFTDVYIEVRVLGCMLKWAYVAGSEA